MSVMPIGALRPATVTPAVTDAKAPAAPKLDRLLKREVDAKVLEATANGGKVDAVVFFETPRGAGVQSAMGALQQAESMPLGRERKQLVFESLQAIGGATMEANKATLEALRTSGLVEGIDPLWSMNAVRLRGASRDALTRLVGPAVSKIVADEIIAVPTVPAPAQDAISGASIVPLRKFEPSKARPTAAPTDPNAVLMDWGVKKMDAPAAWKQGITGAGLVIASLDTGVITDHPGLKRNYRGTTPDGKQVHDHNLWNGIEKGEAGKTPVDDVGHGTHTIGSAVGWSPNHLIGVAPDAQYIVGRGLGEKGGSLFALMAGMEWMLAPTDLDGKNPRPDLAPDIVTNSWGGGPVSNPFLWMALRNWRRAGIVPVFASGNDRNARPGRVAAPGMYQETITVGATEKDDSRAFFSMYGPSQFSNDRKPEVMAPGTNTYSALPDGSFRDVFIIDGKEYPASGTSMATPHVAGAIALYMQAHPDATYDEVLGALKKSGTQADKPDHESGYGRVQVDKLIAPGTIDKGAKLTDPKRVQELMDQVSRSKVYERAPKKVEVPDPPKHGRSGPGRPGPSPDGPNSPVAPTEPAQAPAPVA